MLPTQLMEERLIRQQQEMEEDQRWLEKEERFLVMRFGDVPPPVDLLGPGVEVPLSQSRRAGLPPAS